MADDKGKTKLELTEEQRAQLTQLFGEAFVSKVRGIEVEDREIGVHAGVDVGGRDLVRVVVREAAHREDLDRAD